MEYLKPQKKTIAIGIIALAGVLSVWIFVYISKHKNTPSNKEGVVALTETEKKAYLSEEWKNVLFSLQNNSTTTPASNEPLDQSHTAELARDLFAQYLLLQKNGVTIDENVANRIAENTLKNTQNTSKPTQYTEKNLNITINTDAQAMSEYNAALAGAYKKRSLGNIEDPLLILYNSMENQDEGAMAKIDPLIKSTDTLIQDLLAVPVPKIALSLHLELVQNYSNVLWALQSIRNTYADPVVSLTAVSVYNQYLDNVSVSLKKINDFLNKQ